MSKMEKLGALWMKQTRNGATYFSGKFGEQRIVVFKNRDKKTDKHPDFVIYKSEPQGERKDDGGSW